MQYFCRNGTTAAVNVVVSTGFFVVFCWTFATCEADASGHTIARVAIGVIVANIATTGPMYFILTPCNTKFFFFPSEEAVTNVGYGS
jgi:riboflavin transporter FmnP